MKIVIAVAFYLLYWFCCFLGMGTDKKNLLGLRSYPDEVQRLVKNEPSLWNAILYAILGLNLSGNDETVTAVFHMRSVGENIWNGGVYGIEASMITTVVLAIATVLIWFEIRKRVAFKVK